MVRQVVVVGSIFCRPPILRMSCSPLRAWMIDPEQRNSMALKKAWVEMCRKASCGRFSPMVTIINPSWLDVEKAMIFLMSFCVRAQVAANSVDNAPRQRHRVRAVWLVESRGWVRISRKIPATTIVLEWSRAETGVGPSMAAGNHGWRPNWADFPVAARMRPSSGRVGIWLGVVACWISQVFIAEARYAMLRIRPISPIRLYRMACRAAVLASARPCHQPISRKDMIPTPSQPMNRRNKLLAIVRVSMAIRNIRRKKKNFVVYGSDAMYHEVNWRMDHVTNSAMGKNIIEYWSILKLSGILKFVMNFHSQWEMMLSDPEYMNSDVGMRLIRKAVLMVCVMVVGEGRRGVGSKRRRIGVRIMNSVRSMDVFRSSVVSITFTWICTKINGS